MEAIKGPTYVDLATNDQAGPAQIISGCEFDGSCRRREVEKSDHDLLYYAPTVGVWYQRRRRLCRLDRIEKIFRLQMIKQASKRTPLKRHEETEK